MSILSLINTKGLTRVAALGGRIAGNFQRDPYAPRYEINIQGGRGAQPYSINDKVKQFIESVTYEDTADQFDKLTINFASNVGSFGGDDINEFIDSRLFSEGHTVELRAGYGSSLFTVGAGDIVSIEPDFPKSGAPRLDIICYDKLHIAAKRKHPKGVSYKGKGDTSKATEMFDKAKQDPTYKKTAEYELSLLK